MPAAPNPLSIALNCGRAALCDRTASGAFPNGVGAGETLAPALPAVPCQGAELLDDKGGQNIHLEGLKNLKTSRTVGSGA